MTDAPLFSVSQFTTWHQSFAQDVSLYARLGIEGIEICERKLSLDSDQAQQELATVVDAGLKATSVQPRVHALFQDFMCPELTDPNQRVDHFRQSIDLFAERFPDGNLPLVTITGNPPGGNFRQGHATARKLYPPLADYAADRGVRIMYEPLSPLLMNQDTFICTLNEAMQLIEDVDRPNFGLMLDVWHLWREPDIVRRVAALVDRIFGVHLGDWPVGEPRCAGDRVLPGEGVIDLATLLGAIRRSGYSDAYCLEIFSVDELSDSLWRADPSDVINRGRKGFERAWAKSRYL